MNNSPRPGIEVELSKASIMQSISSKFPHKKAQIKFEISRELHTDFKNKCADLSRLNGGHRISMVDVLVKFVRDFTYAPSVVDQAREVDDANREIAATKSPFKKQFLEVKPIPIPEESIELEEGIIALNNAEARKESAHSLMTPQGGEFLSNSSPLAGRSSMEKLEREILEIRKKERVVLSAFTAGAVTRLSKGLIDQLSLPSEARYIDEGMNVFDRNGYIWDEIDREWVYAAGTERWELTLERAFIKGWRPQRWLEYYDEVIKEAKKLFPKRASEDYPNSDLESTANGDEGGEDVSNDLDSLMEDLFGVEEKDLTSATIALDNGLVRVKRIEQSDHQFFITGMEACRKEVERFSGWRLGGNRHI